MPKPRAVVILGAGASVDFGVPALRGLFKERHARAHLAKDEFLRRSLDDRFWRPRGHNLETSEESLTIEEILTVLRDWEDEKAECGQPPPHEFCERFRKSLYVLIKKAIFDEKDTRGAHLNRLIDFCRRQFSHTTWASFNWDCIFESSFWYSQPYVGPGSRCNPSLALPLAGWWNGVVDQRFLKLHGGINWWMIGEKLTYLSWTGGGPLTQKWAEYEAAEAPTDQPLILEPSFYKYEDQKYVLLQRQWEVFFEQLCDADCVIVVGYSLPENDGEARSKIMVSSQVNTKCRWLILDPSDLVCARYKRLLGIPRLTTETMTLAGFNNDVHNTLQRAFPHVEFEPPLEAPPKLG